jgi:hypothetical protein
VQRLLQQLRDGDSPDDALYSVTQMHYADLEENLTSYLQKKYPPSTPATE